MLEQSSNANNHPNNHANFPRKSPSSIQLFPQNDQYNQFQPSSCRNNYTNNNNAEKNVFIKNVQTVQSIESPEE